MAVKGTREVSGGADHSILVGVVIIALFIGYMLYTGTYNPITALQRLIDTVLGILPGELQRLLRQAIDLILDIVFLIVDELRRFIP